MEIMIWIKKIMTHRWWSRGRPREQLIRLGQRVSLSLKFLNRDRLTSKTGCAIESAGRGCLIAWNAPRVSFFACLGWETQLKVLSPVKEARKDHEDPRYQRRVAVASYIVARRTGRNPIRGWQLLLRLSLVSFSLFVLLILRTFTHSQFDNIPTRHRLTHSNIHQLVNTPRRKVSGSSNDIAPPIGRLILSFIFFFFFKEIGKGRFSRGHCKTRVFCWFSVAFNFDETTTEQKDATGKATANGRNGETEKRSAPHTRTSGNDTAASRDSIHYVLYISANAQAQNDRACQLPKSR